MKQFFNILSGNDACCILLYGYVGDNENVRPSDVAKELMNAEATHSKIDVRINSQGGDVLAGIAIFNALHNSKADITIYIDGVAASMGAVIALCGKPVYMSKYSRLMLHGVSGGCWGTIGEVEKHLEIMESLEDTLCAMLSKKCGKMPDEIRALFFDGKDHWLTATQALEYGLIDGTYDADPIPEDSTPEQIYNICQNRLSVKPKTTGMIDKLKTRPSFANCTTEDDVLHCIESMEQQIEDYKTKEKKAAEQEIITIVDNAVKDERIRITQRDSYIALLRADRKNGEAVISALAPKKRIMDHIDINAGGGSRTDKSSWTLEQYRKYAPKDLQRDPGLYNRLLEKERENKQQ